MASRQTGVNPGNTRKGPRDMTGKLDEKNRISHAEEIAKAAENMAIAGQQAAVANAEVVDMTDEARRGQKEAEAEANTPAQVEVKPKTHRVRILADIEDMTFGREVVDPGDYSDPNNIKYPVLGDLRYYSFQEGREYIVDEDMYQHLKALDYIWD